MDTMTTYTPGPRQAFPERPSKLDGFFVSPGDHFLCVEGSYDFASGQVYVIDELARITDDDGDTWGPRDATFHHYPRAPEFVRYNGLLHADAFHPEEDAFQLPLFEDMPEKTIAEEFEDEEILWIAGEEADEGQPDGYMANIVYQPNHYAKWKIEPITFIMENGLSFEIGNIVKYAVRAGSKLYEGMDAVESEITDLEKVRRYAEMRINQLRGEEVL